MKEFKYFISTLIVIFTLGSCSNSNIKDKAISNNTDTNQVKIKKDSIINKSETKITNNCNVKISKSYTDYGANAETGDMGGTALINFIKLSDGNYEADIEQRFGTDGSTFPNQKVKNLFIDDKGNITFEVKWFTDFFGDKTKTKIVKAKGLITKTVLKFKIDVPNTDEIILNSI